jgi:hypothetical protein
MPDAKKKIGFVQVGSAGESGDPFIAVIEVGIGGFATEIRRAGERGENPAKALLFLADLAARHCNPYHCVTLSLSEKAEWEKYFGPQPSLQPKKEPTDWSAA